MIVPVRRWANTALFGLAKPARQNDIEVAPKERKQRDGLLVSFEKMLAAHTDQVIRGFSE